MAKRPRGKRSRPVTEPVGRANTLAEVLSELEPLDEEFPDIEDLPYSFRLPVVATDARDTFQFSEEARRQSLAVAESRHAEDDQSFIDAISEFWVE